MCCCLSLGKRALQALRGDAQHQLPEGCWERGQAWCPRAGTGPGGASAAKKKPLPRGTVGRRQGGNASHCSEGRSLPSVAVARISATLSLWRPSHCRLSLRLTLWRQRVHGEDRSMAEGPVTGPQRAPCSGTRSAARAPRGHKTALLNIPRQTRRRAHNQVTYTQGWHVLQH